jgi:hypothetical protein
VESAVRFQDDNPADLTRARTAVTAWRDQNPAGTSDELTGIAAGHLPASRGRT